MPRTLITKYSSFIRFITFITLTLYAAKSNRNGDTLMTTNKTVSTNTTWDLNLSFYDYIHLSDLFYTFIELTDDDDLLDQIDQADVYNPAAQILLMAQMPEFRTFEKFDDYETFDNLQSYFHCLFKWPLDTDFPVQDFLKNLNHLLLTNNLHPTFETMRKDFLHVTYHQMSSSLKPMANLASTALNQIRVANTTDNNNN